jgi:phage shock protein C
MFCYKTIIWRDTMVYCQKCGKKNNDDAQYCIKCGNSLTSKSAKRNSFEKQIGDFTEEVEHLGKKAGKTIEQGVKSFGEEVKYFGKKVEKVVKDVSAPSSDSSYKTETEEYKHLYRSGKNKFLGGVCGGVAEYFKIDPTLIRIIWVIIVFFPPGLGIILYILFWIFVPRNPNQSWS